MYNIGKLYKYFRRYGNEIAWRRKRKVRLHYSNNRKLQVTNDGDETMFIPCQESMLNMSPTEFERYSLNVLREQVKGLDNCIFQHNKTVEVDDGNYQIDGYIEFTLMGITYKTIIECKHYKSSITREKVAILYDKIRACGANKGVLVSTSNFQSGAVKYALKHGIALIQLTDNGNVYETRSQINDTNNSNKTSDNTCYIGVMQSSNDYGISCSYLSCTNLTLRDFLLAIDDN